MELGQKGEWGVERFKGGERDSKRGELEVGRRGRIGDFVWGGQTGSINNKQSYFPVQTSFN